MSQMANTDYRSLGELFYLYVQKVAKITFDYSMKLIMVALLSTVEEFFLMNEQMTKFIQQFIDNLPEYLKELLKACAKEMAAA
ncbi:MAG: hypothetical protein LIP11_06445 [Clostridiales bacterium]|nr:hypothetical protein [Clostridiales bacterium]